MAFNITHQERSLAVRRERRDEVVRYALVRHAQGLCMAQIARELGIKSKALNSRVCRAMIAYNTRTKMELLAVWLQSGFITLRSLNRVPRVPELG